MAETDSTDVLVVDDDETYLSAQAEWLRDHYSVKTAADGTTALESFDDSIDVVILDRQMPDLDGDEVAERLRERDSSCQIVMTTGVEPDTDIIDLGIDDYVTKPVSSDELLDAIERALERASYDESLQGYFSLANKRDILADDPEIRETERFSELSAAVDEMAREQLELREEQLQTLFESSPAAIVTLDKEGTVDIWNPAATDLFGWAAGEVVGEEPPMFSAADDRLLERARAQLFQDSVVRDVDLTCRRKDQSAVDVSLSAAPLVAESEMYGTLFVFVDVTERKQRAQQITVMNRVLRHNLRNEINTMMGWLVELEREASDDLSEYTDKAMESARELDAMANKARTIQHSLAEDRDIRQRDLSEMVERQLDRLREEFPDATITNELPDNEQQVVGAAAIDEAIWELLENAVVHNDGEPTRVRVTTTGIEDADGTWYELQIADNGPGIPAQEKQVLFEETEDDLLHGSGLGLWYVKWLVDRSDARLAFSENEMGGSTVAVRLHAVSE